MGRISIKYKERECKDSLIKDYRNIEMSNESRRELVKAGDVLIVQGQIPKNLYCLHTGAVEILSAPKEFEGLDQGIIVSKSKRVALIKEEIFIPPLTASFTDPSTKSVRAVLDSQISKYPFGQSGITQMIQKDPSWAITLLNNIFKMLEAAIANDSKFATFYTQIWILFSPGGLCVRTC